MPKSPKKAPQKAKTRSCWVGAPEIFSLGHACVLVEQAFGETCFLVGSATETREFRDVDVRMIFSDERWLVLFGPHSNGETNPFWSLLCTSVSEYLAKRTGLKVDFQIQRRGSVREEDWKSQRVPLGMFLTDQDPEWKKIP